MLFFFGYTLYAGYLGWQYRRIRTIGDEISALKKTMPAAVEGEPVSPLGQQIAALTEVWRRVQGGLQWARQILRGYGIPFRNDCGGHHTLAAGPAEQLQ